MASRFQGAALVASPSYPNCIAWSEENLIAVASAHIVTILNPAVPLGPRGLVRITSTEPYPIGRVKEEDLLSSCMLSTSLSRDRRPCVRSIAWSHLGMAPNYGCLLAVCTVDGKVKIYRPPYCDFSPDWIEVADISDSLYEYHARTNFGKLDIPSSVLGQGQSALVECYSNQPGKEFPTLRQPKRRKMDLIVTIDKESETFGYKSDTRTGDNVDCGSSPDSSKEEIRTLKVVETKYVGARKSKNKNCILPLITAEQYASRNAMLSSLVVSWSPMVWISSEICSVTQKHSSKGFSILAVGGKSGDISLWRIHSPECYSIEHNKVPMTVELIGYIEAHSSWITAISFTLLDSKSSPQVLMASGSSDGSVKIWLGNGEQLLESSEANKSLFVLVKEVISVNGVPTSILSLIVPVQPKHKMLLAVGKGSGSFEVWACDISNHKFDKVGLYDAHDCAVTGLTWAFDGRLLYSCGQDNYVRGWVLRERSLCEVSIPSNIPGLKCSTDIPNAFLSCLGVASSTSNLAVAMVRSLDVDQLDHMYEGRLQKAVVEFVWIGGQQLNMLLPTSSEFGYEAFIGFPEEELICWEENILWSLTKYEDLDKPLVIWDIIAGLLAFKTHVPKYVDHILCKWLSITFLGSFTHLSIDKVLGQTLECLSKMGSRQLHLLNVVCRRIVLSELTADEINCKEDFGGQTGTEGNLLSLWMKLLYNSEQELRERLVGLALSSFLCHMTDSPSSAIKSGCSYPAGVAQMVQWVELNHDYLRDQIKVMASEIGKYERRSKLPSIEYNVKEQCIYCSASIPFRSPEVEYCACSERVDSRKLPRCAVTMQVCPTTPVWFCKCCHRWASQLAPEAFFTMPRYPLDFKSLTGSSSMKEMTKPFCPFCGILLQRLQPDFLLSATLV